MSAPHQFPDDRINGPVLIETRGEQVDWLVGRITDQSPTAVRLGKQGYNAMRDMSLRDRSSIRK